MTDRSHLARRAQYIAPDDDRIYRPRWWMLALGVAMWLAIAWGVVKLAGWL